jgi:hypothetical protein
VFFALVLARQRLLVHIRTPKVPIWLLRMLNERPQISKVLDARSIEILAYSNDLAERVAQVEIMVR